MTSIKNLTKVTEYTRDGQRYIICKIDIKQYVAINECFIVDGKLIKQLNGLQCYLSDSVEEVIQSIEKEAVALQMLKEMGLLK